jgi:inner membrane transporter RhtA
MPLVYALCAGVLSSAIPYAADLVALRRVSARFFGVFMSVNPVIAAVAGVVLLQQVLDLHEWVGITIVVVVNAVAVSTARGTAHNAIEQPADLMT